MSDNKIVSIFKNVASLHKTLGVLDAALAQQDDQEASKQIQRMFCDGAPADVAQEIALKTLKTVVGWNNPYKTMKLTRSILSVEKLPTTLLDNTLGHYLDAASTIAEADPLMAMEACMYAYRFALNSSHEARIYMEAAALCENPHPGIAYPLLEGALEIYECSSETNMADIMQERVLALLETVASYNPAAAMEAYSYAIDIMSPDDAQFKPTLEKTFAVCEKATPYSFEDTYCVLEQIIRYADKKDPIHQRATELKQAIGKAMTQGDYSKSAALTPAEFLKKQTPPSP